VSITIRSAAPEDLGALTVLFDAYRVWYGKPADPVTARAFLEARIENGESVVYLAFSEDKAVGFTQLYPIFSSTRMKRLWLLNDLYVYPEYRGQGISKMLLERAKALTRETGACELMLETGKTNEIGNRLYPAAGFELGADMNWYYWTPM
jgi:GNAT superfamily N-acetyltransferase